VTSVRHHGLVTASRRLTAGFAFAAILAAIGVFEAGPATAASCRSVTVQNSVPVGIMLSPQNTSVSYGGCVQFIDQAFGPPVTITVAGGYHVTLSYGDNTSGKTNYAAHASGRHALTADNGAATAHGRITVGPAPSHSPSPSKPPSPSHSPSPQPASSSSSSTTGPQVARSPHHGAKRPAGLPTPHPPPGVPGVSVTPGVVPSVAGSPPGPLQSTTPAPAVVAGPLEPPSGRSLGLPAALAALVLIGVGTAVVRVVLAEPVVDGGRTVGGTA
jgi:hypothetical protein